MFAGLSWMHPNQPATACWTKLTND